MRRAPAVSKLRASEKNPAGRVLGAVRIEKVFLEAFGHTETLRQAAAGPWPRSTPCKLPWRGARRAIPW